MASYLGTVVIGNYRITTGEHQGRPVFSAVATQPAGRGRAPTRRSPRTGEVADFLESRLRAVPVRRVRRGGDRRRAGSRYALETQTRPVYAAGFFRQRREHRGGRARAGPPVVRRQRRRWPGGSDIWLNEGFATYAEWLWAEHDGGRTRAEQRSSGRTPADDLVWRRRRATRGGRTCSARPSTSAAR